MESLFKDYINKYFPALTRKLTEKYNDKKSDTMPWHKRYFTPEFSSDLQYTSLSANHHIVAADVISLDSELPLKKRGKISAAQGEIPKLGMKKRMSESHLQQLRNLEARGGNEVELIKKLFTDTAKGVKGVHERLDDMALQALSTGSILVNEDTNTGTGVRLSFNIPESNQYGVKTDWTSSTSNPIEDIDNIVSNAAANGDILTKMFIYKTKFNAFKNNDNVKAAFAGHLRINSSQLYRLNNEEVRSYLLEEFGLELEVIDKVIQIEKDGKRKTHKPWKEENVSFTTGNTLGSLAYGTLVEAENPVDGVSYATVDNFILTSNWKKNEPYGEFTSVQALAIPVLNNTDSIYIMDTSEAQEVDANETEGDANITIWGTSLTKATVITEFNNLEGVSNTTSTVSDAKLIERINELSDEQEQTLKDALGV